MISSSYDFKVHLLHSQRCWISQTARLWFEVLPGLSPVLPTMLPALLGDPRHVVRAPRLVASAPMCSQTYHKHSHGTPLPVFKNPSCSEGWPECLSTVWHSAEIDVSKFTLHILSDTSGGFQWLKYILLMYLEILVRTTGVSGRFVCSFQPDLHFADNSVLCRNYYRIFSSFGM